MPVIKYNAGSDSIKPFAIDSIREVYPAFVGKFKFTSELNFGDELHKRDTSFLKDIIVEYYDLKFKERDSITTDGFQIFADYNTSIKFAGDDYWEQGVYYPVYVVNETNRPKLFIAKDSHVFAVQETRDTAVFKSWRAIESRGFDFCGNGYFGLKVHPGEFIMFLAHKYAGPDTAQMRIRVEVGEHIYISRPFIGSLNFQQFRAGEGTSNSHNYINVYYQYHGALPKNEKEDRY